MLQLIFVAYTSDFILNLRYQLYAPIIKLIPISKNAKSPFPPVAGSDPRFIFGTLSGPGFSTPTI
ncbi:hypothetical protein CU007_1133 [Enterococcus faecium]|nr:hypothetical protein [Enterococcus faecium]